MRINKLIHSIGAALLAISAAATMLHAHQLEKVTPVFERAIPNVAGKSLAALVVSYPPGGKSPSHWHARSAFIYAYVLSGAIRSKVDDEPARVYKAGESFYENPGSHHSISENASDSEAASLLAVFIIDSEDHPLTAADQEKGPRD